MKNVVREIAMTHGYYYHIVKIRPVLEKMIHKTNRYLLYLKDCIGEIAI